MRFSEPLESLNAMPLLSLISRRGDAKLIPIRRRISPKFGAEDRAKRIGLARVKILATKHTCKRPRRRKAAAMQQFDSHGVRFQAIHDDCFAKGLGQESFKDLFRCRPRPRHPRPKMIRK